MNKYLIGLSIGVCLAGAVVIDADKKAEEYKSPVPTAVPTVQIAPTASTTEKKKAYAAEIPLSPELQVFARTQAELNDVPYVLVLAVMEQESRFQIDADGGDSFGLMQINEVHGARDIIIEPHENIKIGCWLLGYLHREYRDWNKALVAYNCGESGAYEMYFKHGSISSPYSREVMLRSERFAQLLGEESVLRPRR